MLAASLKPLPMDNANTDLGNARQLDNQCVLGNDDIHVWLIALEASHSEQVIGTETLAFAERERALRFKFELDRARFLQRRVALRDILAPYLEVGPQDIEFRENEFGKPSVVTSAGHAGLSHSVSHSDAVAVVAVTRAGKIGVDVERVRHMTERDTIAARFFAPCEVESLRALDQTEQLDGFFNVWTCKEAVVKALGGGLSIALDSFEVAVRLTEPPAILRWGVPGQATRPWRIHRLALESGYAGALAVDHEGMLAHTRRWPGCVQSLPARGDASQYLNGSGCYPPAQP